MRSLRVYSREGCPLCDEMLAELTPWAVGQSLAVEVVDVDADPALARRYGLKVPLLEWCGETVCFGHLDWAALQSLCRPG